MTETSRRPTRRQRMAAGITTFRYSIFWGAIKRQLPWVLATLVFTAVSTVIGILLLQTTTAIIDQAIDARSRPLQPLILRYVVITLIGAATGFIGAQIRERIGYQLELDLRNLLYLRLQRAQPQELNEFSTSQIVTRSIADLQWLEIFIRIISGIVLVIPIAVGFTIFMLVSNFALTLLALSSFFINGYLVNRIRKRLWALSYMDLDQQAKVTAAFDQPVRGIRVVKQFGREDEERRKLAEASDRAYRIAMTRTRLEARFDLILRFAPVFIQGSILALGARFVVNESLTIGQFSILFTYTGIGILISTFMDEAVSAWQYLKTAAGRMTQLLLKGTRAEDVRWDDLPEPSTGLEMQGAGVAFGPDTAVSEVTFEAPPGTVTVVVGPPGSGKSTVAGLASATLAPTAGKVLLDGVDLTRIHPDDARLHVHLVGEEPFLFARTIRENLTVGALAGSHQVDASIDDAVLRAALHAAAGTDVVDQFADGLDAELGDRGLTLSGGQRQRLALARALVVPPRVLVLDDAMSALSPTLELEIIGRIRERCPTTSIIWVTRREGGVDVADQVVELPVPTERRSISLAAPADVASQLVADIVESGDAPPYDPRLLALLSGIKLTDDKPLVDDEACERDDAPTLRSTCRPFSGLMTQVILFLVAIAAIGLIPEYVFGQAVDLIEVGDIEGTDRLALGIMAVAVGIGVFSYVFRIQKGKFQLGLIYALRRRMFARLSRLGVDYYDREMPGQVSTRVVGDLGSVYRFFGLGASQGGVLELGEDFVRYAVAVAIIRFIEPSAGNIVMAASVVVLVGTLVLLPMADRAFLRRRLTFGATITRLQEDFAGRDVIKAYGAERRARLEFASVARTHREAQKWSETIGNINSEFLEVVTRLMTAFVFLRVGSLKLDGVITLGAVVSIQLYLREVQRPIPSVARTWRDWLRTRVALRQMAIPFKVPILPERAASPVPVEALQGALSFEGVTFGYPGIGRPVLHDVSFEVAAGDRIAIVGYTGSGKSSIAKLIARIYDPDAGRVLVDGRDVRELDLESFRRRLGVVPQEAFVFTGTVASNVGYGRPDASRVEIEQAVRAIGAYDVLSALPQGLDTPVLEEGRNLTAGERQLVALARAVLVDPDVLVLDEATSSLDADTEARVIDAILGLGRTTVLVTHRMPVAQRADFVIVVDEGRIVEAGTHAELVRARGGYAGLWGYALTTRPRRPARRARTRERPAAAARPVKKAATKKTVAKRTAAKKAVKAAPAKRTRKA